MGGNFPDVAGFTPLAAGEEIVSPVERKPNGSGEVKSDFRSKSEESCHEGESQPMEPFAFHHIGIAVRDLSKAISLYKALMNYQLISGPFDDPIQKVSVCFLSRGEGDTVMELVAPLGANSPIDGVLKKGGGVYHVCYEVRDLSAAIQHLTE